MILLGQGPHPLPRGERGGGVRDGKIDFVLEGYKLKGRFALVRTSPRGNAKPKPGEQPTWLLLKKKDAFSRSRRRRARRAAAERAARASPSTSSRAPTKSRRAGRGAAGPRRGRARGRRAAPPPMLCSPSEGPGLDADGYLYELKLDGVRIIADKRRRGRSSPVPHRQRARRGVPRGRARVRDARRSSASSSTARLSRSTSAAGRASSAWAADPGDSGPRVRSRATAVPVQYLVFDVLALGAYDLRGLPLASRESKILARRSSAGPAWSDGSTTSRGTAARSSRSAEATGSRASSRSARTPRTAKGPKRGRRLGQGQVRARGGLRRRGLSRGARAHARGSARSISRRSTTRACSSSVARSVAASTTPRSSCSRRVSRPRPSTSRKRRAPMGTKRAGACT